MRLSQYLKKENCIMDLKAATKEQAIQELSEPLAASGLVKDRQDFLKHILERENLGSTAVGSQVAIPHARTVSVNGLAVAFGRSLRGIDFGSPDGQAVRYIFLIGTDPGDLNIYLRLLAQLAKLMHDSLFRHEFEVAGSAEEIIEVIKKYEKSAVEVTK